MNLPTVYQGEAPYIFVSYAHRDRERVMPILLRLEEAGFRLWFDEGIDPGTEWDDNIARHIKASAYFIAFITEKYLGSSNCKDELSYVRSLDRNRVLVYLEQVKLPDGLEMRLKRLQAIHWYRYENGDDTPFEKLCAAPGIEACRGEAAEPEREVPAPELMPAAEPSDPAALLDRGFVALEFEEWDEAAAIFDRALDRDAKNAEAYLGLLMAELRVSARSALGALDEPFDDRGNYKKAFRFAGGELRAELEGYLDRIREKQRQAEEEGRKKEEALLARRRAAGRHIIAAGLVHTVGVRLWNGSVVMVGLDFEADVSGWRDIVAVAAGKYHTIGLRSDGSVIAAGINNQGQCDVSGWRDIAAVAAGEYHTVGVRSDGSVAAAGDNKYGQCDISDWTDIVSVAAGNSHTVGVRSDGSVVAAGNNEDGECDVSGWRDIAAVAAGEYHTVGVRSDGSVAAAGDNKYGQCDISDWTDIVSVAAGNSHTVGLRSDGSVVAVGYNGRGQCDVNGWTDIVAIAAGKYHTVGLRSDGSVVAAGNNDFGKCDVSGWKLF